MELSAVSFNAAATLSDLWASPATRTCAQPWRCCNLPCRFVSRVWGSRELEKDQQDSEQFLDDVQLFMPVFFLEA